jgi:hypothetical protein
MSVMSESVVALTDVDGAQLSGPFVEIAKQMVMNCLQVGKVELPLQWSPRKFVRTRCNKGSFCLLECGALVMPKRFFRTPDAGSR